MSGASEKKGVLAKTGRAARFVVGSPSVAVGATSIRDGYSLLRTLWGIVRRKPEAEDGFQVDESGRIDLVATAKVYDVSPAAVEIYLQNQQAKTYQRAWAAALIGAFLLAAWIIVGLSGSWHSQTLVTAIEMMPFWFALGLYILQNGWMNWQFRQRRKAGMLAYIREADTLFPRRP